jgi:hypothetical protein
MTKEATQEGVSALEGSFEEDPREAVYARAAKEREENPDFEPISDADDAELDTELKAEEEPEKKIEGEQEPDVEPDDEPTDEPEEEMVTLKVDGEEVKVPLSAVRDAGVRSLQKESAADKRLEEATRLKLEIDALKAQIPAAPVSEEAAKPQPTQEEKIGRLREIRRKIRVEGVATAEEYDQLEAEEFKLEAELRDDSFAAHRQVDTQHQQEREAQESANKLGASVREKYPEFDKDVFFADEQGRLFKDPNSGMNVFNPEFAQWLADKPPMYGMSMLYSTDMRDIEIVMDKYYESKTPVADLSAKREKKKSIDTIETSKGRAAPKKKKEPETNEQYVARIKRERAQGPGPQF